MTLVADGDDLEDFDTPLTPHLPLLATPDSSILATVPFFFNTNIQSITILPKPPDTTRIANRRKQQSALCSLARIPGLTFGHR
ncbi:hypothetical protein BDR03DRAFT_1006202 [Suillus americanus]|nr:hypothetical protein BDR03DRAFT_1006202 [Suillus americanus]